MKYTMWVLVFGMTLMGARPAAASEPESYGFNDSNNQGQMALSYGMALTSTVAMRKAGKLELVDSLFFSTLLTMGVLTARELSGPQQASAGAHVANAIGVGANVLLSSVIQF